MSLCFVLPAHKAFCLEEVAEADRAESDASPVQYFDAGLLAPPTFDIPKNLASRPESYLVVGALALAPFVFPTALDNESMALNESWSDSESASRFFSQGHWLGLMPVHAGVAVVGLELGVLSNSETLQSFSADILRAQAYNAIVTVSMKAIVNRTRPDGGSRSYPSGHTSTVFASAGVVYSHFGKAWGSVALLGATYVGLSRIADNKHYLKDVIGGAIIGGYIGLQIGHRSSVKRRLSVVPIVGSGHGGLVLALNF